jgi:hypothetical protein
MGAEVSVYKALEELHISRQTASDVEQSQERHRLANRFVRIIPWLAEI